jgi:hypothetical protein
MIAFISGHLDLTQEEFDLHYKPVILHAFARGHEFIMGDARGADTMAQHLLSLYAIDFTVYHMFEAPRNFINFEKTKEGSKLIGGFTTDKERDEAMTLHSDYDITWVREGSRKHCGTALNIKRREETFKNIKPFKRDLTKEHTRVLLRWRFNINEEEDRFTEEELRAELAKRPHIPNKKEGKLLRQQAAKRKQ